MEHLILPKRLAQISLGFISILLVSTILLYFNSHNPTLLNALQERIQAEGGKLTSTNQVAKDFQAMLLPGIFIIFVPWLVNLLSILYIHKYTIASGFMMAIAGLMMLYTIIPPILLIFGASIIFTKHRYYLKHEKYKVEYEKD
ncbi:hypothetical protein [Macrococcus sp. DPC7161]|uniref:hypothetical protein n=1 Tax=Macrococcus sp. DPC7161 TaxID=2507060 RepID=UPI00100C056E|nr:hypothetical protein [Macrococcus sp. DPC7161]RXK18658.1 hypothetical protein ER639_05145 [Macrococcus sp. DPC7161]